MVDRVEMVIKELEAKSIRSDKDVKKQIYKEKISSD